MKNHMRGQMIGKMKDITRDLMKAKLKRMNKQMILKICNQMRQLQLLRDKKAKEKKLKRTLLSQNLVISSLQQKKSRKAIKKKSNL